MRKRTRRLALTLAAAALLAAALIALLGAQPASAAAPAPPGSISLSVGDGSITVNWTETPTSGAWYAIRWNDKDQFGPGSNADANSNIAAASRSHTITQFDGAALQNGARYWVDIRARTSTEYSTPIKASAVVGQPSAPTAVTLSGGDGQLTASWTAPTSRHGSAVAQYIVEYRASGTTDWTTVEPGNWDSGASTAQMNISQMHPLSFGTVSGSTLGLGLTAESAGVLRKSHTYKFGQAVDSGGVDLTVTGTRAGGGSSHDFQARKVGGTPAGPYDTGGTLLGDNTSVAADASFTITRNTGSMAANTHLVVVVAGVDANSAIQVNNARIKLHYATAATATSYTIGGLTNGTTYEVRVKARTGLATSEASTSASQLVAGAPGTVTNVQAETGNASLAVSWTAPTETGGTGVTITGYELQYREVTTPLPSWSTQTSTGSGTTATITGLTNGKTYEVQVKADNGAQTSAAWSTSAQAKAGLPATPSAPTVGPGNNSLSVSWTAPSGNGSAITGYGVRYREVKATPPAWSTHTHSGTGTTATISVANGNGKTYEAQVRATNAQGNSGWSDSGSALIGAPGNISGLSATNSSAGGLLNVSWTAPTDNGSTISGYTVQYKLSTASTWTAHTHSGTDVSTTIGSLTNNSTYQVRVRATNANGNSNWATVTKLVGKTPANAPPNFSARVGNRLTLDTGRHIILNWNEVSGAYRWLIEYRTRAIGATSWGGWTYRQTNSLSARNLTGFHSYSAEYQYRVRAYNNYGDGPASTSGTLIVNTEPYQVSTPTLTAKHQGLDVSWSAPTNPGSAITDYRVEYKKSTETNWQLPWENSATGSPGSKTVNGPGGAPLDLGAIATFGGVTFTRESVGSKAGVYKIGSALSALRVKVKADVNSGDATHVISARWAPTKPTATTLGTHGTQIWSATPTENTQTHVWSVLGDDSVEYLPADSYVWVTSAKSSSLASVGYTLELIKPSTTTSRSLGGLTNDTAYQVRVAAANAHGEGTASTAATGTPTSQPPDAPDAPTLESGPASLYVSWDAPSTNGAAINDYDLRHCSSNCSQNTATWTTVENGTSTSTSATLTGLTNGTTYSVQVRAGSGKGDSDWSPSTALKVGAPDPPTVSATPASASLSLSWTAGANGGSSITDYDVQYRISGTTTWRSHSFTGTGTSTTISSLDNGKTYEIQLRATNANGTGVWSASTTADVGAPLAPTGLVAVSASKSLILSWTAPSSTNGAAITDYDYRYSSDGGATWTEANPNDTNAATSVSLLGLTNGTTYLVQVRAANSRGDGPWSASASETVGAPPAPAPPSFASTGNGRLAITWPAPSNSGAAINDYDVRYRANGTTTWTTHSGDGLNSWEPAVITATRPIDGYNGKGLDLDLITGLGVTVTREALSNVNGIYKLEGAVTRLRLYLAATFVDTTGNIVAYARYHTAKPTSSNLHTQGQPIWVEDLDDTLNLDVAFTADGWTPYLAAGSYFWVTTDNISQSKRAAPRIEVEVASTATSRTISGLTNGTTYEVQVRAANARAESAWSTLASQQAGGPDAPTGVSVAAGDDQLSVSWTAPAANGSAITDYDLRYSSNSGSSWTLFEDGTKTATSTTITGLTDGTAYVVQVRASNARGDGAWSSSSDAVKPGTPAAPSQLRLVAGNATLTAGWTAPANNGSVLTSYTVEYSSDGGTTWTSHAHSNLTTTSSITATNALTYQVRVRALNANGQGAWATSDAVVAGSPLAPDAPTLTVGHEKLDVSWTAPASDNGDAITDYDVRYSTDGQTWSSIADATDSTALTASITGLTNDTAYQVQVSAQNTRGNGAWSASSTATPTAQAPAAPVKPTASATTATWTAPADNGSTITRYEIRYSSDSGSNWTLWQPASPITSASFATSTLPGGLTLVIQVRAVNAAGPGEWSPSSDSFTLPARKPDAPDPPSVAPLSASSLSVSWTQPQTNGSAIIDYDARYSTDGSTWTLTPDVSNSTATSVTITGLQSVSYQVQVSAANAQGQGDWSASTTSHPGWPAAPTGLTLTSGNAQLAVAWTAPSYTGATALSGYDVEYRASTAATWSSHTHTGTSTSATITASISNGTTYEVRVRAKNSTGTGIGPWSAPASVVAGLPDTPAAPTLTSGNAQFTVAWVAPSNNGSTLTGFKVRHSTDGTTWATTTVSDGSATSTTISSGISNNTSYQVQVAASNANGDGPWSDSTTMKAGLPAQPSAPTLTSGDQQLTVGWTDPAANGNALTGIDVQYKENSVQTWTDHSYTWSSGDTSTTITGLDNSKTYDVRVRAANAVGDGPWSESASGSPTATIPAAPDAPTLTSGNAQITVTWVAPTNTGGRALSSFKVRHSTDGSTWTTVTVSGGSSTSTTLSSGIVNGTSYQVQVAATNDIGDSLWSTSSTIKAGLPAKMSAPTLVSDDTELDVSWSDGSGNGNTIDDYDVRYSSDSGATWTEWQASTTSTTKSTTITGLTNGTSYDVQVRAGNSVGDGPWSDSATLKPGLPDAPTALTVASGNASLTVGWTAPSGNGSSLTGYDVQYSSDSGATWSSATHSGTTASATIGSLTNGTSYQVRVRAKNTHGAGPWTTSASAIKAGLPAKVTGLTLTAAHQSISATWTAPSGNGSNLTGYDVEYSSDSGSNWTAATHSGTTASATIGSLTNSTSYDVRVRAKNSVGDGPWSDTASATPATQKPDKPAAPTLTAGHQEIAVSWTAPAANGAAITDYDVRYSSDSGANWVEWNASNTSTTIGITITGLTNSTTYQVQVRATNDNGDSDWSDSASATPATQVPDAPSAPALVSDDAELDVSWAAPDMNGGTFSSYSVQYSVNEVSWLTSNVTIDQSARTATITGLTNGTLYYVSVRATNSVGPGAWSNSASLKAGLPDAMSLPTLTAKHQSIDVSWTAGSGNGTTINDYDVRYKQTSGSTWTELPDTTPSTDLSATIGSLTNGTGYDVQVRAGNSHGDGPWSSSASATPTTQAPGAPAAPTVALSGSNISVSWSAPSDTGGSAITDYDVRYSSDDGANWTVETDTTSTATTRTLSGLTPGASYVVSVRAQNSVDPGEWSPKSSAVTIPSTVPATPAAPTLGVGNAQIPVSWTAPADNGSAILDYDLRYKKTSDSAWNLVPVVTYSSGAIGNSKPSNGSIGQGLDLGTISFSGASGLSVSKVTTGGISNVYRLNAAVGGLRIRVQDGHNAAQGTVTYEARYAATAPTTSNMLSHGTQIWTQTVGYIQKVNQDVWADEYLPANTHFWITTTTAGQTNLNVAGRVQVSVDYPLSTTTSRTLSGLTNGSTYEVQIRAVNARGNGAWSSSSTIKVGAPAAPAAPGLVSGNTRLDVSWNEPADNGSDITAYSVQHCSTGCATDSNWVSTGVAVTFASRTAAITGLTNDTTYQVRVRATNANGPGPWSNVASKKVGAPAAPAQPDTTSGNAQLGVSWAAPADSGSTISAYTVEYSSDSGATWSSDNVAITLSSRTATITGLTNGTAYQVRVRATNARGSGGWSPVATDKPGRPPAPATPTLTVGVGQLTVAWTAPTANGPAINDYDVQYRAGVSGDWTSWDHSGTAVTATITGLDAALTYQVQVRAASSAGPGPWTTAASASPTGTVPAAPAAPRLSSTGATQMLVSWDAPADTGSPISDYDVRISSDSGANWTEWDASTTSTDRSATVTGLTSGTTYQVQVRATNGIGNSLWSASASLAAGAPADVGRPSVVPGHQQVAVSWSAPADHGSAISDYDVRTSSDSGASWTEWNASNTSTATSATVTGLTNWASYIVQVRATNARGDGAWSQSSTAVSPGRAPDAPAQPTLTQTTAQQIDVAWTAPSAHGSTIADYDLRYRASGTTDWTYIPVVSYNPGQLVGIKTDNGASGHALDLGNVSLTGVTVTKVTTGGIRNVYRIDSAVPGLRLRLSARNSSSGNVTYQARYAPTAPTTSNMTTHGAALWSHTIANTHTLSGDDWTPALPAGTHFWISTTGAHSTDSFRPKVDLDSSLTATSQTLTGLTTGATYEVQVRAANAFGESGWSTTASLKAGLPAVPAAPTLTPTSGQIAVSWTAPVVNGGGAISDYRIRYRVSGTNAWSTYYDLSKSTSSNAVRSTGATPNAPLYVGEFGTVGGHHNHHGRRHQQIHIPRARVSGRRRRPHPLPQSLRHFP